MSFQQEVIHALQHAGFRSFLFNFSLFRFRNENLTVSGGSNLRICFHFHYFSQSIVRHD